MYDPIELSKKTKKEVIKEDDKKKYYRYRATRFYGGISTADTVGCNLRCKFCWSGNRVWNTNKKNEFYTPEQVTKKLHRIAEKKNYEKLRISGGEPTIGKNHLIQILENIRDDFLFILETNGILLGNSKSYVKDLTKFPNLHVRVSIKGCNPEEFKLLTGAEKGFNYQLKALRNLKEQNLSFNIAVISAEEGKSNFYKKLKNMGLGKIMVEEEKVNLYPNVRKRLKEQGMLEYFKE